MATYTRARGTRLLVVGLLLASLVTITVDARGGERGPLATVGRLLGAVIGPLQEGVAAVFRPIGGFFSNVLRAGSLAERVRALEEENARLRASQQELDALRAENEEYEGMLDLSGQLDLELKGATVTGESPSNFEWAVFVDLGSLDGISQDMPVIAAQGLVGRVVQVWPTFSKVMLIIDPDSRVSARLAVSRRHGLLEGQRDQPLQLSLIDPDTEVQPGEQVETSGYQLDSGVRGLFPDGIPIGAVESVEPSDDGLDLAITVRPYVDFSALDKVAIVTGVSPLAGAPEGEETGSEEEPAP